LVLKNRDTDVMTEDFQRCQKLPKSSLKNVEDLLKLKTLKLLRSKKCTFYCNLTETGAWNL